jgi:tetratricopeptide (TPR) repeat protein
MTEQMLTSGYEALRSKDLKDAHDIFKNILDTTKRKKERYDALIGLSITYKELGDLEEAVETGKKAVKSLPNPKLALFNLGNYYEEMGEHALAIQNYDLAITIDPDYSDAYINRGVAWFNLNKMNHAQRDFKNAMQNDPRSSRAMADLGLTYLKDGKYEKAIDLFDRSLEVDPENIHSLCGKGLALFYMDQYDESVICFDAALSINPDFYVAGYYKGHILKKLDLVDEAEEAIKEAIESRENYALAWFELGEIYRLQGEMDRALRSYEKAITYQGESFEEALFQKGMMLKSMEDWRGAVDSFKRICKTNPYIPQVWVEMGKALSMIPGKENKAISSFKNGIYLKPSDPEGIYHLALLYLKQGNRQKALGVLKDGLERTSDSRVGLLLSKTLHDLRMHKDAINIADDVLAKDPNIAEAWLVMGRSYGALRKEEEYKQCLRKYLHMKPDDAKVKMEMEELER